MIGVVALVAAVVFGAISAVRLMGAAPVMTRNIAAGSALLSSLCSGAQWHVVGDTRWLVAAALMLGATIFGFSVNSRIAFIVSLALGALGIALLAIALVTGYHPR